MNEFSIFCNTCFSNGRDLTKTHIHVDGDHNRLLLICYECGAYKKMTIMQKKIPTPEERALLAEKLKIQEELEQ